MYVCRYIIAEFSVDELLSSLLSIGSSVRYRPSILIQFTWSMFFLQYSLLILLLFAWHCLRMRKMYWQTEKFDWLPTPPTIVVVGSWWNVILDAIWNVCPHSKLYAKSQKIFQILLAIANANGRPFPSTCTLRIDSCHLSNETLLLVPVYYSIFPTYFLYSWKLFAFSELIIHISSTSFLCTSSPLRYS